MAIPAQYRLCLLRMKVVAPYLQPIHSGDSTDFGRRDGSLELAIDVLPSELPVDSEGAAEDRWESQLLDEDVDEKLEILIVAVDL